MRTRYAVCLLAATAVIGVSWLPSVAGQTQPAASGPGFATSVDITRLNYLTPQEQQKLTANGFVLCPHGGEDFRREASHVYAECHQSHFPVFVTGDVMLHTEHLLFDWSLRFMEMTSLDQDLIQLTDALLTQSLTDHDGIGEAQADLKRAAMKNAIFFNVAKCLLTDSALEGVPQDIRQTIEKELALIRAHEGLAASPLFGYTEDYSQYVPRGHYSRSEEFQRYFQAMVWYGRMGFHLSPVKQTGGKVVLDKQAEVTETLQALLICRALAVAQVKGEKALDVWNRVYETTCFFAGRSDDLSVRDYATLMDQVYGPQPLLAGLADRGKLAEFIARARRLPKPRILSIAVTDVSSGQVDWQRQEQAMRFMGQRFTPDAHVFQNLVYDRVTRYRGQDPKPFTAVVVSGACFRGWPRGLDLVAVWGCPLAAEILRTEGDTDYDGYEAPSTR